MKFLDLFEPPTRIAEALAILNASILQEGLVDHAKTELKKAGLFDKNSDYDGMLGKAVLDLVKLFADQRHSGCSAGMTMDLFKRVGSYENLSPLTSDPDEWSDVSHYGGKGDDPMWQSKRSPSTFSRDGGKTWYDLDDPKKNNGDSVKKIRADYKKSKKK